MADPSPGDTYSGPPPRVIHLAEAHRGARLDLFLAAELGLSRGQVRRLLESGAVRLDGRDLGLADKGRLVEGEAEIEIAAFRAPADQRVRPGARDGVGVLAEGSGWVAIDKPAGMPVHPLREDETGTALGALVVRWPALHGVGEGGLRSGVVHRLDVETSGVLLVATEEATWRRLRGAFQQHAVAKTYRAIVSGRFDPPGGEVEMALPLVVARHRPAFVRAAREEEVRRGRARTIRQRVRVVEPLRDATLVAVHPETGFLHQIRASLADLGHPLLGDRRYASERDAGRAPRHMLHAARAAFEEIEASAPDAADFAACLASLRD